MNYNNWLTKDDDDQNGVECLNRFWRNVCLCDWLGGYTESEEDVLGDTGPFKGRDLTFQFAPHYDPDQDYTYFDNNDHDTGSYSIYCCGYLPAIIAYVITMICCGCRCFTCRLKGKRGLGWLLSSRAGRTRLFAWIVFLLLFLGVFVLWSQSLQLENIYTDPCYVCRLPRDDQKWWTSQKTEKNELIWPIETTRSLSRYAEYVHGPQCALDDNYIKELDRERLEMWRVRLKSGVSELDDAWLLWDQYQSGGPESEFNQHQMRPDVNTLPKVFVLGCRGAGTTSLGRYLSAHPQVWMGPGEAKDHFFATFPDWTAEELKEWVQTGWSSSVITPPLVTKKNITKPVILVPAPDPEDPSLYYKDRTHGGGKRRGRKNVKKTSPPLKINQKGTKQQHDVRRQKQQKQKDQRYQRLVRASRKRYWSDKDRIKIDLSPDAYWSVGLGAASSIRRAVPDAKFLVVVRDPVQLIQEAHARATEVGLEDRSFTDAIADELPDLIQCLLYDGAGPNEQRERLVTGACGGLQASAGPPYIWRGMLSEFLLEWLRVFPNRKNYYFIRSQDLLRQPNRTLNGYVVRDLGLEPFDFSPYVKRIYKPRGVDLKKMTGSAWASLRSTVPRIEYIAQMRRKASDALLKAATDTVIQNVPGATTSLKWIEAAQRLHCGIMAAASVNPDSLMMYHCEKEASDRRHHKKHRHRKHRKHTQNDENDKLQAEAAAIQEKEIMLMLRQFMKPYHQSLLKMMINLNK